MLVQSINSVSANSITSSQLTTTGVVPKTYGSASQIPSITVGADGRVTSVSNTAVSIPSGAFLDSNNVIFLNNTTITSSVIIPSGTGAFSIGPVLQAPGTTFTVSANARYIVF